MFYNMKVTCFEFSFLFVVDFNYMCCMFSTDTLYVILQILSTKIYSFHTDMSHRVSAGFFKVYVRLLKAFLIPSKENVTNNLKGI